MHSEDRSIHYSCEMFHAPRKHKQADIQKLYYELSQTPGAGYDNTNFTIPGQPRLYSKRGDKSQSIAVLLPDRLMVIEEWADCTLSDFCHRLRMVAEHGMEALEIKSFLAQTITLRSTCGLSHHQHALPFLMEKACQQQGKIEPYFQRPLAIGGLKFVLPEGPEHPGTLHISIEPFRQEPREVFVEVKAAYRGEPIEPDNLDILGERVTDARGFVTDNIYPYLEQFDTPGESGGQIT